MTRIQQTPPWFVRWMREIILGLIGLVMLFISYIWNDHVSDQKHTDKLQDKRIDALENIHERQD